MDSRQIIALLMPPLLLAVMLPTFRLLARKFGKSPAWYAGLVVYWILWGAAFTLLLLGPDTLLRLLHPPRIQLTAILLSAIPVAFAAVGRFFLGMRYEKPAPWVLFALLATAIGNGLFEELLWRGAYLVLFPNSIPFQMLWPSVWFGLWHYAPGSVSPGARPLGLMVSALFLGLFLSFLARQTGTLWWPILAHTLAGIVMVI